MSMSSTDSSPVPNEVPDNGLGDGGHRLHEWALTNGLEGVNRQVFNEAMTTGAIVAAGERDGRLLGRSTSTTACRSSS